MTRLCSHCYRLCWSKMAGTPATSARWAQLFTGQEINMASAGCLHMAQCRRSSCQFLIRQQKRNPALSSQKYCPGGFLPAQSVLRCSPPREACSDIPEASYCWPAASLQNRVLAQEAYFLLWVNLLVQNVVQRFGQNDSLKVRCVSNGLSLAAKMLLGVCLDRDRWGAES